MLGRVSTGAAVGAAAWVVPEILTAKPAAGASLSGGGGGDGGGGGGGGGSGGGGVSTSPTTTGSGNTPPTGATNDGGIGATPVATSSGLALTGVDVKRDAEVGAAMVAGGWAMHKWASRVPKAAGAGAGAGAGARADHAGIPGDTA
jgi:hypothetical protein